MYNLQGWNVALGSGNYYLYQEDGSFDAKQFVFHPKITLSVKPNGQQSSSILYGEVNLLTRAMIDTDEGYNIVDTVFFESKNE